MGPKPKASKFKGVTRHKSTGRYEARFWDNSSNVEGRSRNGKQVYLGTYADEESAAKAYDLAALKYLGPTTQLNFPLSTYEGELEGMEKITREEFVVNLRRNAKALSEGASMFKGVTRNHGKWKARIRNHDTNKDLYLGTFDTEEEAAKAYDSAVAKNRDLIFCTNFKTGTNIREGYSVQNFGSTSTPLHVSSRLEEQMFKLTLSSIQNPLYEPEFATVVTNPLFDTQD